MKKILSFVLLLVLLLSTTIPVIAYDSISTEEMSPIINVDTYAREIIYTYIDMNISGVSATDEFFISQGFVVDGNPDENSRTYFLFKNNICVGELTATYINGQYISAFSYYENSFITEAFIENKPLHFTKENDSIFAISNDSIYTLYGENCGEIINKNMMIRKYNSSQFSTISLNELPYENFSDVSSVYSIGQRYLGVIRVQTDRSPDTGAGLCWAASIAAIGNYCTNIEHDALSLYNLLKTQFPTDGIPEGILRWKIRAFAQYNIDVIQQTGGYTFSQVVTKINELIPIYADIQDSNGNGGHAVVICGYKSTADDIYTYRIMDPNKPAKVDVSVPQPTLAYFYYPAGTYTYTDWKYALSEVIT